MIYYIGGNYSDELYHYGVKGMHWGIRRYQNYDGTRIGAGEKAATRVTPGMKSGRTFKSTVVGGQGGKATGTARLAAANIPEKMGRSSGSDSSNASSDADKMSTGEKVFGPSYKRGKGKENSSVAQETANHVLELNKANRDIIKNFKDADPKVKAEREKQERSLAKEAKKMSDKELRDSINRIKMEREYVSLNSKETETGYDKALDILNKAEPFIKVAAEVAGLILLLYKIKGMGHSAMDDSVADVFVYCVENGFDDDIIEHAANLDFDYILDYYDIDEYKLQHILDCEDELYHHGIKGQKWGVRRFQNPDGTRIGTAKRKPGEQRFAKLFGNSVAGGQGGKATGTARLATKLPAGKVFDKNRPKGGLGRTSRENYDIEIDKFRKNVFSEADKIDTTKLKNAAAEVNKLSDELGIEYDAAYKSMLNDKKLHDQMYDECIKYVEKDLGLKRTDKNFNELLDSWTMEDAVNESIDNHLPNSIKIKRSRFDKACETMYDENEKYANALAEKFKDVTLNNTDNEGRYRNGQTAKGEDVARYIGQRGSHNNISWEAYVGRHFDDYWVYDVESRYKLQEQLTNDFLKRRGV